MSARAELEVDDVEEEDEEGDKEEARCFFSRSSSFHRTVHFGGLGDGSSSTNQTLGSSLLISCPSPTSASLVLRLILLSFSECCICQKGSNRPSKKSSSAVSMNEKNEEVCGVDRREVWMKRCMEFVINKGKESGRTDYKVLFRIWVAAFGHPGRN
ncbi:hypothetical protein NC653_025016 [Populus alba x Populus x berolinensis]|uniref:Uncharacterized protein n=1 Tax=Populus alba x Populus x berolinensis TaxID=444605 RepID=A0AAD6Q9F2_9ROSI|nr:hypothetical protein NC653_025016 [Populus alba x Populus x berolinensis]